VGAGVEVPMQRRRRVPVRVCAIAPASPAEQHARREDEDDDAHESLRRRLDPGRQLSSQRDQWQSERHQHRGVAGPPPGPDASGRPHVGRTRRHQRGHGHQVVGIGRVPQPHHDCEREHCQERRAGEQRRERLVEALERLE
jgi:hypothetical protein